MVLKTSDTKLGATAIYYARLARGHGSLQRGVCNVSGCDPMDKSRNRHLQERFDLAQDYYNGRINETR